MDTNKPSGSLKTRNFFANGLSVFKRKLHHEIHAAASYISEIEEMCISLSQVFIKWTKKNLLDCYLNVPNFTIT